MRTLLLLVLLLSSATAQGRVMRPRLVVVCTVDQLATWVFEAAREHFAADGGFRRLLDEGVEFPRCAYAHGCTETGPGHATISTGVDAAVHGIVKNEWFDPEAGAKVYCASDPTAGAVPGFPEGADKGPARLLVPTVGDLLKRHSPASKVVAISHKDRSAVLTGGREADAVVWIDNATGRFVTSGAWGPAARPWHVALDAQDPVDKWFGWTWERLRDETAYAGLVDDRLFEAPHATSGERTLPAVLTGGRRDEPSPPFWLEIYLSPASNELVLQATLAAMRGERLGQDADADLLFVSFSATDTVGHYFGPDSVEARDTLLRLDVLLARFLTELDDRVGRGQYALVLSADHGVGLPPDEARAKGLGGGRGLLHTRARAAAEKDLRQHFGVEGGDPFVRHAGEFSLYLDAARIGACSDLAPEEALQQAQRIAAAACARVEGIARGFATADLLAQEPPADDPMAVAVRRGLHPARAGDVVFVVEPYWLEVGLPASHGTPHPYDREVALLACGPGLAGGKVSQAEVGPGLCAVLAAFWLGIEPPAGARDAVPEDALPGGTTPR